MPRVIVPSPVVRRKTTIAGTLSRLKRKRRKKSRGGAIAAMLSGKFTKGE